MVYFITVLIITTLSVPLGWVQFSQSFTDKAICEKFMNQGRNVYMVDLPNNTDPSDLGFEKIHNFLENTNLLNFSSLIKYRLLG